ncbi:MAG TPA: hypothetical protein VN932_09635 [Rhizomicrobium sp.]|nr:hypothetical protein [Rhizomicrobium sp.]
MPVADFAQGIQKSFPMAGQSLAWAQGTNAPKAQGSQTTAANQTVAATGGKSFWDDMLDVVNPLQHLPVVGTIYRAITGDKMGDLEKVAGDALYGGPIGLVSSLADVAFEKITGKDFGDTVLDFVTGGDKTTAVAANAKALNPLPTRTVASASPAPSVPATPVVAAKQAVSAPQALTTQQKVAQAQASTQQDSNTQALMAAMSQDGVDSDLGMRALFAYQKSMGLNPAAPGGLASAP